MSYVDKIARQGLGISEFAAVPRDMLAGLIGGLVNIAYCLSFAALIFQGDIADGFSLGLSSLLTGTAMIGAIVALTSSFAPADAGPDTPAIAVMSVMAAGITAQLGSAGYSTEAIVIHVMMAITVATLITGLLLMSFGLFKLGLWLRFVPYPVVGGFLGASGWLLITGGIQVATGVDPGTSLNSLMAVLAPEHLWQFAVGVAFAASVVLIRQRLDSVFVLPVAFLLSLIALDVTLLGFGFADRFGGKGSWYLGEIGALRLWMPAVALATIDIDWRVLAANAAEIGAVCGVTSVSLLLDVTSMEVARQQSADLDKELRTTGAANLVAGALGGVTGNLSLTSSILLTETGAVSRLAGLVAGIICIVVLFIGANVVTLMPVPLLGGLLGYLGVVILGEAFLNSPAQRSRTDMLLAAAIMAVIIYFGYLLGVLLGVIGACLLFAFSYSRIGVVRRHLTRRDFSSNVERPPAERRILRENGAEIHVFWLSGFIFFGSSNGLFEYVRRCIEGQVELPVRYVLLDFGSVPGFDTSAVLSLVKLRNYCDSRNVTLAFADLTPQMILSFESSGFFAEGRAHRIFGSRNEALEWCENKLLDDHVVEKPSDKTFEHWLVSELGGSVDAQKLLSYFERRELAAGQALFKEGEPSDSVELLAAGTVAITITDEYGRTARLRRMAGQTVVGEMGFYRNVPRGATVIAEEDTIAYRLTREAFERMQREDSGAVAAFHRLIVRVLADRLEFANREISALL